MLESLVKAFTSPWGFGSILVICTFGAYIISKAGYFAIEKLGIYFGKKVKEKTSPHTVCPHSKDIMNIIHRTTEHYEKIQTLKISIIEEQMRYYEEIEEEVVGTLKHIFTKIIIAKLEPDARFMDHEDYKYYALILKVVCAEIKSYVGGCFKSNHYSTYDIESQRDYVDKKKVILTQKITALLNDYWRGSVVTRGEIYENNQYFDGQFGKNIEDIFNRAFLITRSTYELIEKEEISYGEYLDFTIGTEKC